MDYFYRVLVSSEFVHFEAEEEKSLFPWELATTKILSSNLLCKDLSANRNSAESQKTIHLQKKGTWFHLVGRLKHLLCLDCSYHDALKVGNQRENSPPSDHPFCLSQGLSSGQLQCCHHSSCPCCLVVIFCV